MLLLRGDIAYGRYLVFQRRFPCRPAIPPFKIARTHPGSGSLDFFFVDYSQPFYV